MKPVTLYGIPNCDTVKKARAWLTEHQLEPQFHDFKKAGVPADALNTWLHQCGWETVINRKGTTWRKLDEATRQSVLNSASAQALALTHASVIKRPIVAWADGTVTVGFDPKRFAELAAR